MIEIIERLIDQEAKLTVAARGLAPGADLYRLGLTPFTAIRLLLAIEREFGVEFPRRLLNAKSMSSIEAIAACLRDAAPEQEWLEAA